MLLPTIETAEKEGGPRCLLSKVGAVEGQPGTEILQAAELIRCLPERIVPHSLTFLHRASLVK